MLLETNQDRNDPTLSFHLMKFAFQNYKKSSSELSEEEYIHSYQLACEEMLLHQLILSSEEACYVMIPDPVIQRTLQTITSEYPEETDFHTFLMDNGLRLPDYLTALASDLRVEAVLAQIAATVQSVGPLDILHYFRNHQDDFRLPERRIARHILIFSEPSSPAQTAQAFKKISAIRNRVERNPENFHREAKLYSQCSNGKKGGKLGTVQAGELCNELDRILFSMDAGAISPVIESDNGFHLLYCQEILPAKNPTFAETYSQIFSILLKKKQLAACRTWLKALVQND